MFLYSNHDTSIMSLLQGMGEKYDFNWPSFSASLIFELYKDKVSFHKIDNHALGS